MVSLDATAAKAADWEFHTAPEMWKEARVFHIPTDVRDTQHVRFEVRRDSGAIPAGDTLWSPNDAYYFVVTHPNSLGQETPWSTIHIYNERPYLIHIAFENDHRYDPDIRWINEKLMFIGVWWGRALGTDFIFDVEEEAIIYQEMTSNGTDA